MKRGKDGSLSVSGPVVDDVRPPAQGLAAPLMSFVWQTTGSLALDLSTRLYGFTLKQSAIGVTATVLHQDVEAKGFKLPDVEHCAEMLQVAP